MPYRFLALVGLVTAITSARASAAVEVPENPSFRQDVIPVLTKAGCNSGGCHGKEAGQNGFKLSLRGYAPEWDYEALSGQLGSRRLDFADPAASLLLTKAAGEVAHEGGKRFDRSSPLYATLLKWVEHRGPGPVADDADPVRLELSHTNERMKPGETKQLQVFAHYPDGRKRDVTWLSQFFSNDPATAAVSEAGLVTGVRAGETSIRAHFQGIVAVVTVTMPFAHEVDPKLYERTNNAVDVHVLAKLKDLHIPPSPDADDATFVRRAFLDAIGLPPTPEEVLAFLADKSPEKRAKLVDSLLSRPEWADYWALQLGDLLQNRKERDHDVRGTKGVRTMHAWIRNQLVANRPWDEIARDVLTVKGDTQAAPQAGYFVVTVGEKREVEQSEVPDSVAQAFLGTRIGCARCHNHPLEKYTQDDFYHFAAFFSKVSLKRTNTLEPTTLVVAARDEADREKEVERVERALADAKKQAEGKAGDEGKKAVAKVKELEKRVEQGRKELADVRMKMPSVRQPRTNKMMSPQPLDRSTPKWEPGQDPRESLAAWMTDPSNEAFAGAMVNRLWKHFMGVGMVEPVDDLRSSNPPSNPQLWKTLAGEFVKSKYDLKHVQRLILTSRAYALDAKTLPENETETRFYSRYYARRLPAEVLLDAIAAATDVPDAFPGYPVGTRAVQVPDPGVSSYFLTLFGRSERVTACACEKNGEVTLPQLLHLSNSQDVQNKVKDGDGRLAKLLKAEKDDRKVTDALFLATVGRPASDEQWKAVKASLGDGDPREQVFQDLFWALLNSKEFAFNR
ncbi:MAG TPA: DUF1549 domain-containing protein [Humisphaera sp.]